MTKSNSPAQGTLLKVISVPSLPALLYPWPEVALNIGLPWVWPNETAGELNKLEPFIAERVALALTSAQHEWAANETVNLIAARREGRLKGLREAVACAESERAAAIANNCREASMGASWVRKALTALITNLQEGKDG